MNKRRQLAGALSVKAGCKIKYRLIMLNIWYWHLTNPVGVSKGFAVTLVAEMVSWLMLARHAVTDGRQGMR
jgi:hypothetical protein